MKLVTTKALVGAFRSHQMIRACAWVGPPVWRGCPEAPFRAAGFHPWQTVFKLHLRPWKFWPESGTVASLFGERGRTRSNIYR